MDEEREIELEMDKVYSWPVFKYIEYNGYCLAIASDVAKWLVIENNEQYEILRLFCDGYDIQSQWFRAPLDQRYA